MKILITGASGLLGQHLVRQLISGGHQPVAMLRDRRKMDWFGPNRPDFFIGNSIHPEELSEAIGACQAIVHCAADTRVNTPLNDARQHQANVEMTENLLVAAKKKGIGHFIHVSTVNAFQPGSPEKPGDELGLKIHAPDPLNYIRTKRMAHDAVQQAIDRDRLPGSIVAPSFMIGGLDFGPSSGALLLAFLRGKLPGIPATGGRNFVHVADVAHGIRTLLDRRMTGTCHIFGNENLLYRQFFEKVALVRQSPGLPPKLPAWLANLAGFANLGWSKISGSPPRLTPEMVRSSFENWAYSSEKAIRELDFPQTPINVAIQESIGWLEAHFLEGKRVGYPF